MLRLKEIHIKNFKSLRDCKLKLGNFNVLVGANATGKTNLVDLFLLLRKIYVEKDINPFRYWWGYQNAVWNRKEELDISVRFVFEYVYEGRNYEVHFETTFTGRGGRFEILREVLEIKNLTRLELYGNTLKLTLIKENSSEKTNVRSNLLNLRVVIARTVLVPPHLAERSGVDEFDIAESIADTIKMDIVNLGLFEIGNEEIRFYFPIDYDLALKYTLIINKILKLIFNTISKTLVLKLNINEIKRPTPLRRENWLIEDGSNLNSVLYNIYLKENRIPERIATTLSYLFPNINLGFSVTEDQRVYLKIQEDGLELPPVCIADGLYKLLAILTALELKPSLLIIDEVENSLHPETLEKLLDELKSSETVVIITTHSPVVVDMTDPADLVIVEKIAGETKFRRIENPEEIKKKLKEAGITFSESWLYGQI